MKKHLLLVFLIMLAVTLFACDPQSDPDPEPEGTTYSVTFLTSGGSSVEEQTVDENTAAVEPEAPTKNGESFRYWYIDDNNLPYDFSTPVTEDLVLKSVWSSDVSLGTSEAFDFTNLTTEFDVEDGTIDLYFESSGHVPYVKVTDFFDLLTGFIDPEVDITFTEDATGLTIFYQYYDEDEDETYDLECRFDVETNLITTNDPGFYWAYIYSVETNYGRNIEYLYDHESNEDIGGDEDVIYNLNLYDLDLTYYDDGVVAPYYLVNQLFAGSSYYNVYYNGEDLSGVYGTVSPGTMDYMSIRRSSLNSTTPTDDILQHSYDMFAFDLDYFYGLKDIADIDSYYTVLSAYQSELFSDDYEVVSQAIANILLLELDDPHTSYGFSGYYASTLYNPPTNMLSYYGERFNEYYMDGYVAVDDAIAAKWNVTDTSSWAYASSKRPDWWLIDETSAVISFDSFLTSDIEETETWSDEAYESVFEQVNILPAQDGGSRYFVYNQSDQDDDITETLIWGLDSTFVDDYSTALESDGWTEVIQSTLFDYHRNGYYTKTINDVDYMVTLNYKSSLDSAYIGLTSTLPETYEDDWLVQGDIEALIDADSAVYLESVLLDIIDSEPNVVNVGLDLTFNGGGNVGALYRIVGLITDQPFATSGYERDLDYYSTFYITTNYESYTQFDWFLLTSKVTYSAANELATIFAQNDLGMIIGRTTGGGAASITPILLPDGTFFTMSSNSLNALRLPDGTYEINEFGVDPDYEIDVEDLFDNDTLASILNGD